MIDLYFLAGAWCGVGLGWEVYKVMDREVDFSVIGLLTAAVLGPIVILLHIFIIDRW